MLKRLLSAAALGLPLLALAGCSTNPATGQQSFTAFMSPQEEVKVGAEENPKVLEQFGGAYGEDALRAYVTRIGDSLVRVSERAGQRFTFTVLNDPLVNAFALPGGYVYVTRGLLALADDEAELAGVLAHEIGHVVARHAAQRYSRAMAANLGVLGLGILGAAAGLPAELGNLAAAGAQLHLAAYSRDQEMEADMLGVRYLARAGYDPRAMAGFLDKMQQYSRLQAELAGQQGDGGSDFLASHPRTATRIDQAARLANVPVNAPGNAPGSGRPRVARAPYLAMIDGMIFGDDPRQGVVRGRTFAHPGLGVAFTVPPGFALLNGRREVVARNAGGAAILFDMLGGKGGREAGEVGRYLGGLRVGGRPLEGIERITVGGLPAATGHLVLRTDKGPADLRLVAIRERADRVFRLIFVTPTAELGRLTTDLQRTTYSFRRLSVAEARAIRPLRLRVVAAPPGATAESMARDLPFERFRLDWFRALNGLKPGQPLPADGRVKIVSG